MTFSGSLLKEPPAAAPAPAPSPETAPDPSAELLVEAVLEVHAARGDVELMMRLFRQASLWVEVDSAGGGRSVRAVRHEELRWLPVFSSSGELARFCQATDRGSERVEYGRVTGAEVIDEVLPGLPFGTGMLLDPLAPHAFALPAVSGIVPPDRAVNRQEVPGGGA